jgi:hypothetical protein
MPPKRRAAASKAATTPAKRPARAAKRGSLIIYRCFRFQKKTNKHLILHQTLAPAAKRAKKAVEEEELEEDEEEEIKEETTVPDASVDDEVCRWLRTVFTVWDSIET